MAGISSIASADATERRPRRADYWATPRRANILLLHGTYLKYLKEGPLLHKDIDPELLAYFETWPNELKEGYLCKTGNELHQSLDWNKLWNACLAVGPHPVHLNGSEFESFCSLLEQVSSIETPKAAPGEALSISDQENGNEPQRKADTVPEVEIKG